MNDIRKRSSNYDGVNEKAIDFVSIKNNSNRIKKFENIFIKQTFINKRMPRIKKMPCEKASDDIKIFHHMTILKSIPFQEFTIF